LELVNQAALSRLPGNPSSAALARRFVRSVLIEWGHEHLIELAELLANELVTNSVLHTESEVALSVSLEGETLRVEVHDNNPQAPMRRDYSLSAATGRGLVLVEKLSSDWGTEPANAGKVVWFELAAEAS
jgi:anti-sigma regulatory factor (Ser/Thr protein kinase)